MPSTIIASSSSRILRAPRSAAMAEPPAPAISSDVAIGPASRTTASTAADPVNDWAPNCLIRPPTWRAMTAPNGMATRAVGMIVTEAMNQACWRNSRSWKGRRNRPRHDVEPEREELARGPDRARAPGEEVDGMDSSGSRRHGHVLLERARGRGDAVLAAPRARLALAAAAACRWTGRAACGIGGSGGSSWSFSASSSSASFSSDIPIGPTTLGVEELPDDRLLGGQQHLARPEHGQVLVVEQPDVVRARSGRC